MQFILTGFTQDREFRVFALKGSPRTVSERRLPSERTLALSRTYGIRLQELPLMCRAILEAP